MASTSESLSKTRQIRRQVDLFDPISPSAGEGNVSNSLDFDPLDFLEREFLARAIIQFSRAWRLVIGDGLGVLQRAAVLQIGRSSGGAKGVTTGGIATVSHVEPYRRHIY
jgi:hypothetical protein